jgi:hypothetical protein
MKNQFHIGPFYLVDREYRAGNILVAFLQILESFVVIASLGYFCTRWAEDLLFWLMKRRNRKK